MMAKKPGVMTGKTAARGTIDALQILGHDDQDLAARVEPAGQGGFLVAGDVLLVSGAGEVAVVPGEPNDRRIRAEGG